MFYEPAGGRGAATNTRPSGAAPLCFGSDGRVALVTAATTVTRDMGARQSEAVCDTRLRAYIVTCCG